MTGWYGVQSKFSAEVRHVETVQLSAIAELSTPARISGKWIFRRSPTPPSDSDGLLPTDLSHQFAHKLHRHQSTNLIDLLHYLSKRPVVVSEGPIRALFKFMNFAARVCACAV